MEFDYYSEVKKIVDVAINSVKLDECISIDDFNNQVFGSINSQVDKLELSIDNSIEVLKVSTNATIGMSGIDQMTVPFTFPFQSLASDAMKQDCTDEYFVKYNITNLESLRKYLITL